MPCVQTTYPGSKLTRSYCVQATYLGSNMTPCRARKQPILALNMSIEWLLCRLVRTALEAGLPVVSPHYLINWVAHPWTSPLPAELYLHSSGAATPATVSTHHPMRKQGWVYARAVACLLSCICGSRA
eukprot:1159074-Pelagomonas_calceolata.AAC.8